MDAWWKGGANWRFSAALAGALICSAPAGARAGAGEPATPSGGSYAPPGLASADGRFTANLRAVLMLDSARYFQKDDLPPSVTARDLREGTIFRRARLGVEGQLFGDFDYTFIYEFDEPGRIHEASLTYTALKPLQIKVGAFEPNVGLAAAVSTSRMPILERPSPAEIARNVAGGDSRVAVQVSANGVFGGNDAGVTTRWFATTAVTGNVVTTFSSAEDALTRPFDEQTAWVGRAALSPYATSEWLAHLGVSYQYVIQPNDVGVDALPRRGVRLGDRPESRVDGTRLIDTGRIGAEHVTVLGLEGALQSGSFLVEGEWFRERVDRRVTGPSTPPDPRFGGWYVQGSLMLTGEKRRYDAEEARFNGPAPAVNFNPTAGTWGAFELAGRYAVADLNYRAGAPGALQAADAIRGGEQRIWTAGFNWYLNPAMRLMLDVQRVKVERLSAAGLQAGQAFNTVAVRGQINF